jgi:hypothetical protein
MRPRAKGTGAPASPIARHVMSRNPAVSGASTLSSGTSHCSNHISGISNHSKFTIRRWSASCRRGSPMARVRPGSIELWKLVRTILNRAARCYRDADSRPWLESMPPLITMLPESPRAPLSDHWKEQDTLFAGYLLTAPLWHSLRSIPGSATATYAACSGLGR